MALKPVEKLVIPNDMKSLLAKNGVAKKNFEAFSPSSKRGILQWILTAKRTEIRNKGIKETVRLAALNLKGNHRKRRAGTKMEKNTGNAISQRQPC